MSVNLRGTALAGHKISEISLGRFIQCLTNLLLQRILLKLYYRCLLAMSEEEPAISVTTDTGPSHVYLTQFRQHLAEVQAHLNGFNGQQLQPTKVRPFGYWTAAEKDLFFHALSLHSRVRPDLIADCVGTKSIFDVCAYIDALDVALLAETSTENTYSRSFLEPAMEMSQRWIRWEERESHKLMQQELSWQTMELQAMHENEVMDRKTLVNESASSPAPGSDTILPETFEEWRSQKEAQWAKEAALGHLESVSLNYLEDILRDSGMDEEDHSDDGKYDILPARTASPGSPAEPSTLLQYVSPITDDLIDPALCDIPVTDTGYLPTPIPSQEFICQEATMPGLGSPLPQSPFLTSACQPSASPSSRPSTPSIMKTHPQEEMDAAGDIDVSPSHMSPQSRRRLKKRLYMRRKRAQLTGAQLVTETVKLKRGRKPKLRASRPNSRRYNSKKSAHRQETEPQSDPEILDAEKRQDIAQVPRERAPFTLYQSTERPRIINPEANLNETRHSHPSGNNRFTRTKSEWLSLGIDSATLTSAELDFFCLGPLGRLLSAISQNGEAGMGISSETLRLLKAVVTEFTSQLVHLSVVVREQERRSKSNRSAWHLMQPELISLHNVALAAEMMGVPALNHRGPGTHEQIGMYDSEGGAWEVGTDEGDDAQEDPLTDAEESNPGVRLLSLSADRWLHQGIYPAFFRPSPALAPDSIASTEDTFENDIVVAGNIDEGLLLAELEEEEALDQEDTKLSRRYENLLAKEIKHERMGWFDSAS